MMKNELPKIDYVSIHRKNRCCTTVKSEKDYLKKNGTPTKTPCWIFDEETQELKVWNTAEAQFISIGGERR